MAPARKTVILPQINFNLCGVECGHVPPIILKRQPAHRAFRLPPLLGRGPILLQILD
jgi:hypothetical protein